MEWRRSDGYVVSDDPNLLDLETVHRWLSNECYWAAGRSFEVVKRSVESSLTLGCYAPDGRQIGVCRFVTDSATFGWLCDVFVASSDRGDGVGSFMVGSALSHPTVKDLRLLLATRDAHRLYQGFGFSEPVSSLMERPRSVVS